MFTPDTIAQEADSALTAGPRGLFYRRWQGQLGAPVLIYLHGIEGHSLWFQPTAARLTKFGFNMYAPDRRGAGMNQESRGHLTDYRILLQDIREFICLTQQQNPQSQIFLLGNCWGAKAAILIAAEGLAPLSGLILTSPALKTKVDVALTTKLRIGLAYAFGSNQLFDLPIEPRMFTKDPNFVEFIERDPLRLTKATAAFLIETLKLRALSRRAASRVHLPAIVFQSGRDDIAHTTGGDSWFRELASQDKTMHLFPNSAHTPDFDDCADEFATVLANWVLARK